jgi:hypothetical protein
MMSRKCILAINAAIISSFFPVIIGLVDKWALSNDNWLNALILSNDSVISPVAICEGIIILFLPGLLTIIF